METTWTDLKQEIETALPHLKNLIEIEVDNKLIYVTFNHPKFGKFKTQFKKIGFKFLNENYYWIINQLTYHFNKVNWDNGVILYVYYLNTTDDSLYDNYSFFNDKYMLNLASGDYYIHFQITSEINEIISESLIQDGFVFYGTVMAIGNYQTEI